MDKEQCYIPQNNSLLEENPTEDREDNIIMDIKEIGLSTMDCIDLAKDGDYWRVLVNLVLKVRIP